MSASQYLGAVLVALPFVGLFVVSVREQGWRETAGEFAFVAIVCALVLAGAWLLAGGR